MSEIFAGIKVSVQGITTMGTNEKTFGTRTKNSALGTDLGSVTRICIMDNNTYSLSFISDKHLKLIEAPVANPIIHSLPSVLLSYSFKVFQNNLATTEIGDNVLANVVIDPSHKPSLSATNLLKKAFGSSCAFSLELSPQELKLSFGLLHNTTIKKLSLASDCEVIYSEVNTENIVFSVVPGINLFREHENKKSPILPINFEKTLTKLPTFKIVSITSRDFDVESFTFLEQAKVQHAMREFGISRKIVFDTSSINQRFSLSFFDDSASLTDTSSRELTWQSFSELSIYKRVQFDVILDATLPGLVNTILESLRIGIYSPNHRSGCFDFDFAGHNAEHIGEYVEQVFKFNGGEAFPLRNKIAESPCLTTL